jgi:hypothetical protein
MLRTITLAAALLALAAPAQTATVELRAGPVSLAPGQFARTLVSNAGTAPCRCLAQVRRGAVQEDGFVQLTRQASAFSLPGGLARMGVTDPDIMPELVQAEVSIECRSLTAAQMRGVLHLTLETAASRTGPALVTMQGTE